LALTYYIIYSGVPKQTPGEEGRKGEGRRREILRETKISLMTPMRSVAQRWGMDELERRRISILFCVFLPPPSTSIFS
jgi:hypothetical protein